VLRYRVPSDVAVHAEYVAEAARQLVFANTATSRTPAPERLPDDRLGGAERRLPLVAPRADGLRAAPGLRGPEAYIDLPADPDRSIRASRALAEHADNDDLRAAVVLEASPKKVVAMLQSAMRSPSPAKACGR